MAARFNRSLGAVYPNPPSTCLGTIKIEEAMAPFLTKDLRDNWDAGLLIMDPDFR
jgi:hypothetical protein